MEHCKISVILSRDHVILSHNSHTLWCDRSDGRLTAGSVLHRDSILEYVELGKIWGLVGKIRFFTDGDWKLVVVTQASSVGMLPHGGEVYCVDKIGIIPLTAFAGTAGEIIGMEVPEQPEQSHSDPFSPPRPLSPTLGDKLLSMALGAPPEKDRPKEVREREKIEKRLTEALLGMFSESQSFYFCLDSDLTQSLQRQIDSPKEEQQLPLWEQMDERFFWNKWMLSELLNKDSNDLELSSPWVFPLIQGYVEVREIPVLCEDTPNILQPGWSMQYREEREKLLQECGYEGVGGAGGGGGEGGGGGGRVEVEMQDMASIQHMQMMVPMSDLTPSSSMGFDTDSGMSENDSIPHSPVKATSQLKDEAIPKMNHTHTSSANGGLSLNGLDSPPVLDREHTDSSQDSTHQSKALLADSAGTVGQSVTESMPSSVCADSAENAAGNSLHADSADTFQSSLLHQNGEVEFAPPKDMQPPSDDKDTPPSNERDTPPSNEKDTPPSNKKDTPPSNKKDRSPSNKEDMPPSNEEDTPPRDISTSLQRENDLSTNSSSGSLFYTTQEVPELGGIMIDVYEAGDPALEGGVADVERLPVSEEGSVSETTESLAMDASMASMRNPFLEAEEVEEGKKPPFFTLAIISRRSCHRAGTRYKRRGVDGEGHVANFVETELVLKCGSHVVSYVIIRGSVPVYWSQPGNKYRPVPVIEKTVEETQEAFQKHFKLQLKLYKELVAVNLVKQAGREKLVGDAFERHMLLMEDSLLSYVTFDFHQNYKVNQSMALHRLVDGTSEFARKFKFCWIDAAQSCGALCRQEGVFRVNCMDCLDRTNVVESILSREVLQVALQKLGMLPFDEKLGGSTLISYQEMWGNNGDVISKQYAGTAAMKGDITRYGERRITGLMKDGYNSAHRYYLNVFRDSYRQVLIDLMQGVNPYEAFVSLPRSMQGVDEMEDGVLVTSEDLQNSGNTWSLEREEAMAKMLTVCTEELFPSLLDLPLVQPKLSSWVLMEAAGYSFLGDNKEEESCIVIHSKDKAQLCVAKCNMETKKVICFLRIPTAQISKIVVGQLGTIIRNTKRLHMRVHYSLIEGTSCYFTFTTAFCVSMDEDRAILLSIAELLVSMQPTIAIQEQKISKKKSGPHQGIIFLMAPITQSFPNLESHDVANDEYPSAPNSPTPLQHDVHVDQKLSRSCENLLSNSMEATPPPLPLSQEAQPSIMVTSPNKPPLSSLYDDSKDESDSEAELEFEDLGREVVGVTNPMVEANGGEGGDEEMGVANEGNGGGGGGGKFSRLKGRLLRTANNMLSRPLSSSSNEDGSSSHRRRSPSPAPEEEEMEGRSAVGGKKTLSPSLWRKMKKTASNLTTSDGAGGVASKAEVHKSKSRIIHI